MHVCYLQLGSNLGCKITNLKNAILLIKKRFGYDIFSSSVYVSKAWGYESQPDFLNQVVKVNTHLSHIDLLDEVLSIEDKLGRIRTKKWGERIIDIDILFYDNLIFKSETLSIPHPYIAERRFVLLPLNEIVSDLFHPEKKKKISELLKDCKDKQEVSIYVS